ncbi:helix-turn-helix transcriptional regulator, partial [Gordonia effusa]|uniref:helix-turn-helix transcriptional regulator n=1 Tax=Gordonia effusa TaxID=263908 RepID=UPI003570F973
MTDHSTERAQVAGDDLLPGSVDGQTRDAVIKLLVQDGPLKASDIAERLGISAAGVRRHLDALTAAGDVEPSSAEYGVSAGHRGRGRPAKWFQLTSTGRGKLRHAYDDLAGAALRALREAAGDGAVEKFARDRVERITEHIEPAASADAVPATVEKIASALTGAGYATNTRHVGNGVQICQHH